MKTATKVKSAKKPVPKAKPSEKLDLYSQYSKEYAASPTPGLVTVGAATYLSISGEGAPGGPAFTEAIGALYGVAFTVKMTRKFAGKQDYVVSNRRLVAQLQGRRARAGQRAMALANDDSNSGVHQAA